MYSSTAVDGGAQEKGKKDRMKLSLLPKKLMEKLVWVPVIFFPFVKFSLPVPCLMPYYAETGCSRLLIACENIIYYVVAQQWMEEALRKKERQDETQFITKKIDGKTSLGPRYFFFLL
jgi:hypothetical protein